jgi:hypothetical protein
MTSDKQLLEQALACLEESYSYVEEDAENAERLYGKYPTRQARIQGLKDEARKHWDVITAIRARLKQPEQEPVGVFREDDDIGHVDLMPHQQMRMKDGDFVYTTPPAAQRQWVGLTEDDWKEIRLTTNVHTYGEAIEAKLKEKNT